MRLRLHAQCKKASHYMVPFMQLSQKRQNWGDTRQIGDCLGMMVKAGALIVKAMVFPVIMYRCESWTVKKAEH